MKYLKEIVEGIYDSTVDRNTPEYHKVYSPKPMPRKKRALAKITKWVLANSDILPEDGRMSEYLDLYDNH